MKTDKKSSAKKVNRPRMKFNFLNSLGSILGAAMIIATIFTMWTPSKIFSNPLVNEALLTNTQSQDQVEASQPTETPSPQKRVGIVSGHWGNDSGAVCKDGLTERDVNLRIATFLQQDLIKKGYEVDLLQEFDEKLNNYEALALVSIHADSCDYINETSTGFKVAPAMSIPNKEKSNRLTACIVDRYQRTTGLEFDFNRITNDMTNYHAFGEINSSTPAAIIEVGYLNLDREILTQQPDLIAEGVAKGILCYILNEPISSQESQPVE